MKVLTLREPWASLIGDGIKTIETRSWPTNYRGELYIHAGKHQISSKDRTSEFLELLSRPLNYGHIFAKCKLIDCIYIDEKFAEKVKNDNLKNYLCGDFSVGRYAWILSEVTYIDAIPAKGHLGIWNY